MTLFFFNEIDQGLPKSFWRGCILLRVVDEEMLLERPHTKLLFV